MKHKWITTGLAAGLFLLLFSMATLAVGVDGETSVFLPVLHKPEPTPTLAATAVPTAIPTPTNTPAPPVTAIPTATATTGPQPGGIVEIIDIFYDGQEPVREGDEYVEIRNNGSAPIQLQGWTLEDDAGVRHTYTFPSFVMQPGQTCRVYTDEYHPEWCGFNYGYDNAIWNNTGDCAHLKNRNGIEVDTYCYS